MGSMHNSVDAVEDMINSISACCQGLRDASQNISVAAHGDWEDEVSQAYADQMQKISKLVNSPVSTLESCGKKLIQLKSALEKYQGIRF